MPSAKNSSSLDVADMSIEGSVLSFASLVSSSGIFKHCTKTLASAVSMGLYASLFFYQSVPSSKNSFSLDVADKPMEEGAFSFVFWLLVPQERRP